MRRILLLAGLAAVFGTALAVRLKAEQELRGGGPPRFVSPDCLYHMRRAELAVAHFPRILLFDPTINFPQGGVSIWPPLFDVALALPARIIYGAGASKPAIDRLASYVPPLLGALAAVAAALLAGSVRRGYAVPVGLFVALCGAHVQYSQYGHTDQHVAESLTSLVAVLALLRARARPGVRREIIAGLALAVAALTWQGALCWAALFALVLGIEALRKEQVARPALLVLGLAAAADAVGVAFWTVGDRLPFTFVSFGWFQPAFLAALCAGVIGIDLLAAIFSKQRSDIRPRLAVDLAGLGVAAIVLGPRTLDLWHGLLGGIGDITKTSSASETAGGITAYPHEMLRLIFEARPLFADGPSLALQTLSAAVLLVPVAACFWVVSAFSGPRKRVFLVVSGWALLCVWLALQQRLYIYYLAPVAGLAAAEIARQTSVRSAHRFRSPRRLVSALVLVAVFATLLPGLKQQLSEHYAAGPDLIDTMFWAKHNLPHAVSFDDPRLLPPREKIPDLSRAEAILSPWALGHFITYYAEMPTVGSNFCYGFEDTVKFFLATSEEEALAIARRRRARWILAADLMPRMNDYGEAIGRGPYVLSSSEGTRLTPDYFKTMQSRLYDFDGAGPWPLQHLRLIHQSRTGTPRFGRFAARWKIFVIDESAVRAQSGRTPPKRGPAAATD